MTQLQEYRSNAECVSICTSRQPKCLQLLYVHLGQQMYLQREQYPGLRCMSAQFHTLQGTYGEVTTDCEYDVDCSDITHGRNA